ncbi:hypothetical protein [Cupriavidus basilensis]|uniref:Uncharacterized protein n=1 Tax=Cupriavidus basilensis TaxID=68895 RepID=A0A0C4YPT9_9BURK|nr:hypothetical protein [Cupriavidus basilensis]AJG22586.1 hypothetical protein RR42_s0996 [Cupriavidus basilensis]
MYYGRNGAGADSRELVDDDGKPRAGQKRGERCDSNEQSPWRANWAWEATTGHYDWMDSHTPFAHYD